MKYDDATWHTSGNFPKDLPSKAGATHIGMFAAWCMLNGLAGELHTEDFPEDLDGLRRREVTPGAWFVSTCDSQLVDEDLSDEGNAFATVYYAEADAEPNYVSDLAKAIGNQLPTIYHLPDTWKAYDQLAQLFRFRFNAWKRRQD